MKLLRDASIKRKLYAIILGTATAVLMLSLVASLVVQIGAARDSAEAHLRALAAVLGANSRAALVFRDRDAAAEVMQTLTTQQDVVWAGIVSPDGSFFAEYHAPVFRGSQAESNVDAQIDSQIVMQKISVEQPILLDKDVIGSFRIVGDMSRVREILFRQALLVLGVFVVAMLFALLLSSRLQRMVSVPVRRLLDTMGDVAATRDFARRAERVGNDELGQLTDGFNEMLDRIQAYDRELETYRQGLEDQVVQRTEELEWAKERAEAASKAKSEFLATISHEIRTPMTGVIGFTRLLEKTELNNQQRDYTRIIGSSAHSLLEIIDEILEFSKMEAGKVELENRDFDIRDLLNAVRITFTPKALEKGISLDAVCSSDVPMLLHGDPGRVRQVLINLVGNAVKFTDQGSVDVRMDKVGTVDERSKFRISVRDTGIGISAEQQALLFQPFQQGDGSITRRYGGTGLGLVIAQRLVRLMEGEISLSSALGGGSVFTATIVLGPARGKIAADIATPTQAVGRKPHAALVSAEEVAPALANLSVLAVDDSPINLKLATALLSSRGVEVVAVESALKALQTLEERSFDLVLMDLEMPEMSGMEAATKIRASHGPAAQIPIVAITAHAFPEKRQEVIEAGMNDLLAKPYLPEQLYAMIAKWCSSADLRGAGAGKAPGVGKQLAVYDEQAALAIVEGDRAAAQVMLDEFLVMLPKNEAMLRTAYAEGDDVALYQATHKLSGSAPIVGAAAVHGAATHLLNFLKQQPMPRDRVDAAFNELLQQIQSFLEVFANRPPAADEARS